MNRYAIPVAAAVAAFQQILHGLPAVNYTSEDLIYMPRNPRVWKIYGFSAVEQIIEHKKRLPLNRIFRQIVGETGRHDTGSGEQIGYRVSRLDVQNIENPVAKFFRLRARQTLAKRDPLRQPVPRGDLLPRALAATAYYYRLPGICRINVRLEGAEWLNPRHDPNGIRTQGYYLLQGWRAERQSPSIRVVSLKALNQFGVVNFSALRIMAVVLFCLTNIGRIGICEVH